MAFSLPIYRKPDFDALELKNAPDARWAYAPKDGVAPEGFHSTSMYPEYFKLEGVWRLATESRMDASVVWREDGRLDVVENRNLKQGDRVILGRTERAQTGFISTQRGLKIPKSRMTISSSSGRAGAAKRPTRAITTISWSFCATKRSTGTFSGSWGLRSRSTMTRAGQCRN